MTREPSKFPHSASIAGAFIFFATATPPAGKKITTPPSSRYFFAFLPVDVNREKKGNIEGVDPGAPENPKIIKKIIYCTLITSGIFIVIYLLVINEILNLRNFLN